ncbi:polysaccharide deacetylase family protein [Mycolicibacterium sp. CBMA 361]|uniref:polysaccharide deacetylase family protein n=1 Tax=Mycolicibacterium sp. CBMA 361 TaxID=2606610 RepID=UPI0012DEA7CE|nr:polysaccharide deacetylase family protein [Mycolicibacterium sp. CBMA 361]
MPGPSHLNVTPRPADTAHWADWARNQPVWRWPNGKKVAVTITFDVDAETAPYALGDAYVNKPSRLSEARFSVVRGVPRILDLFKRFDLHTTFFVPGWTAEAYPHVVESIMGHGHEIGHHGYVHSKVTDADVDAQRDEIERGFDALVSVGVPRPTGYRNPMGEMSFETLELIRDAGFHYDSSFLGDDRPYIEKFGDIELLELPWHWSLDDWPYFGYDGDFGGTPQPATAWYEVVWGEFEQARDEGRNINIVCHPEIIGRDRGRLDPDDVRAGPPCRADSPRPRSQPTARRSVVTFEKLAIGSLGGHIEQRRVPTPNPLSDEAIRFPLRLIEVQN